MEYQDSLRDVFARMGYSTSTEITDKQFYVIINHLNMKNNNSRLELLTLLNQIWKETKLKHTQKSESKESAIKTQEVIETITNAIEIFFNRIEECTKTIDQLEKKWSEFQQECNDRKLEIVHNKILTLRKDKNDFERNLDIFNQIFHDQKKYRLQRTNTKSSYQKITSIRKTFEENEVVPEIIQTNVNYTELLEYLSGTNGQLLNPEAVQDLNKALLLLVALLILFQASSMIAKCCFVNTLAYLFGIFVLFEQYRQYMTTIVYYTCIFTTLLDSIWLLLNSQNYLYPKPNTGHSHLAFIYSRYTWFISIVQFFVKILYLILLFRYRYQHKVLQQQIQKQEYQKVNSQNYQNTDRKKFHDRYMPNMKEFVKLQTYTN